MFCGEGFPNWASKNEGFLGFSRLAFPWPALGIFAPAFELKAQPDIHKGIYADFKVPTTEDCSKDFEPLVSWAVAKNYENLYKNVDGLLDKFADYWKFLATTFKNSSNVIGYELLNEPNFTTNILSLIPGVTGEWYLQSMYDRLGEIILGIVPDTLIFFEPTTWSNEFPKFRFGPLSIDNSILESKLTHPPGGFKNSAQSVLAYHYYDFVNHVFKNESPEDYFASRQKMIKKFGTAGIVTEFELNGVEKPGDSEEISEAKQMDYMDDYLLSWAAWTYKSYVPKQSQTDFVPTCTGCGDGLFWDDNKDPLNPNWNTS